MMENEELIKQARATVALITSYSPQSKWAKDSHLMYEIFQLNALALNKALGEHQWDWEEELKKDRWKNNGS